jgi:hypothetical protein
MEGCHLHRQMVKWEDRRDVGRKVKLLCWCWWSFRRTIAYPSASHGMSHDIHIHCSKQYVQIWSDVCRTNKCDNEGHGLSLRSCSFAPRSFETSGAIHPPTKCHIPEDLTFQQHRCENLKRSVSGFRLQTAILQLHHTTWELLSVSRQHVACES